MIGDLIIHLNEADEPYTCEECDHVFGQGYTAHWCPFPEASGYPTTVVAPTYDKRRWIEKI